MRKYLAALLTLVFMLASTSAFAADASWKLAGTWNYSLNISGIYGGNTASLTEAGTLVMRTTHDASGAEVLDTYDIKNKGNVSIEPSYTHDYSSDQSGIRLNPLVYTPGATYEIEYDTTLDGAPVHFRLVFTQTGANDISGTAYLSAEGKGYSGPIKASRPSEEGGSGGGGCNAGFAGLLLLAVVPFIVRRKK